MKFAFIDRANMARGSYRIFVHDLSMYLRHIGHSTSINPQDLSPYDVVIYGKGCVPTKFETKLVGIVNPPSDRTRMIRNSDFVIVGSCEERDSIVRHNQHCYLFPLIERMYLDVKPKTHWKKDVLVIGYHGNVNHLNHMALGLSRALERLRAEIVFKFVVMCEDSETWSQGRPSIEIEFKKWRIETIAQDIQEFDIGVVPNISEATVNNRLDMNMALGIYNTDYKIRFKNKSNIGRALVFFQLGIPVVADLTPSNMHILANPDNGYAVLSEDGWYYALKKLCCERRRNWVSKHAYNECKRQYDPLKWAERLADSIGALQAV